MTRFYFDLSNGGGFLSDEEGRELPDVDAAMRAARREILGMASAEVAEGRPLLLGSFIVIRRGEDEIAKLCFGDVVEVRGGTPA